MNEEYLKREFENKFGIDLIQKLYKLYGDGKYSQGHDKDWESAKKYKDDIADWWIDKFKSLTKEIQLCLVLDINPIMKEECICNHINCNCNKWDCSRRTINLDCPLHNEEAQLKEKLKEFCPHCHKKILKFYPTL